jgi:transcriptional regulator with AAA-type ATPase domain
MDTDLLEDAVTADVAVAVDSTEEFALVVRPTDQPVTHRLPRGASVTLGPDASSSVVLGGDGLGGVAFRLHLGSELSIEDLKSTDGIFVRGGRLEPGGRRTIGLGEIFFLGQISAVVVRSRPPTRRRYVLTQAVFEERLEEECCRSSRSGNGFALLRVSLSEPRGYVRDMFFDVVRAYDLVAELCANEFILLLAEVSPGEADVVARRLQKALSLTSIQCTLATVCFGRDGRTPEVLIARSAFMLVNGTGPDLSSNLDWYGTPDVPNATIQQIAEGNISVLITGETGVGKEVLASKIHHLSPRAPKPFLRLNCAAIAPTLLESELFGHERGAFTGAVQTKPGLLETAHGGTVFLDEIGELPLSSQAKLLRVVEERRVLRVGGVRSHPIDVRFLAATNRNLEGEITSGTFRSDLYYRLCGITLHIEPLRKRKEEIGPLARRFIDDLSVLGGRAPPELSSEATQLLEAYEWPGNIRELRNVIERALLVCRQGPLKPGHLMLSPRLSTVTEAKPGLHDPSPPRLTPPAAPNSERERIIAALASSHGNQTAAAELLGMSRRTFVSRLTEYGLPRPRKGRSSA